MKTHYLLISILIFTICSLVSGCSSAPDSPKTDVPAGNSSTTIAAGADNNAHLSPIRPSPAPTAANSIQQTAGSFPSPVSSAKTQSTKGLTASRVSRASFEELKTGMSYPEVVKILGSGGSSSGALKTPDGSMAMYSWKGTNDNGEWNVTARFDNGKLVNKVQFGLK